MDFDFYLEIQLLETEFVFKFQLNWSFLTRAGWNQNLENVDFDFYLEIQVHETEFVFKFQLNWNKNEEMVL